MWKRLIDFKNAKFSESGIVSIKRFLADRLTKTVMLLQIATVAMLFVKYDGVLITATTIVDTVKAFCIMDLLAMGVLTGAATLKDYAALKLSMPTVNIPEGQVAKITNTVQQEVVTAPAAPVEEEPNTQPQA